MADHKILLTTNSNEVISKKSYWSMFYYAIISTIRQQKTLTTPWDDKLKSLQSYKGQLIDSSFFSNMIGSIKNHGFEYLMVEFLRTEEGWWAFEDLCESILEDHGICDFNIKYYNITKTGVDYSLYENQLKHNTQNVNFLLPGKSTLKQSSIVTPLNGNFEDIYIRMIKNSDIYIEVSDGHERFSFVGEVEGNDGDKMLRPGFFKGIKGLYSTFGICASDRKRYSSVLIDEPVKVLWAPNTGHWILHFKKLDEFYLDYITAAENMRKLVNGHHSNLMKELRNDPDHQSVLQIINNNWQSDVTYLLNLLIESISYINGDKEVYNLDILPDNSLAFTPSQLIMSTGKQYYSTIKK